MVSIVNAVRDIARVREVSTVLVKHGFGEVVGRLGLGIGNRSKDEKNEAGPQTLPIRIRRVLEDLGPSFVKLGQLASTRADLLPPELIRELCKLQDSAPQIPMEDVRAQIELSLGAPIEEKFEDFDETPLAAASIAQVHRAKLRSPDGPVDVAVKIQRPKIASKIASDVEILHSLAALLERAIPETRIYSPIGLIQQFDQAITAELDFISEGDNARRFAENFENYPGVRFPQIHREASSKQVLTMEFLQGVKINQSVGFGYDKKAVAKRAFAAMIKQIYEDGFFHADPHPGNVLVSGDYEDPLISFVDLGMVGRLSPRMRDLTIDVVMACLRKDYEAIADALYAIGTPTKKINMDAYKAEVALLAEKYLGKQLRDIEISAMIRDLVRGGTKFGIEIPTDFVMMGKSLMTVEGIGKEIDPEFDVYEEARPLFSDLLRKRYSPERVGNEILRRIERLGGAGYKVPQQVEEVLDDLRFGRLVVRSVDEEQSAATERLGRRLLTGVLSSSCILGGSLLVALQKDHLGYALFTCAILFILFYATSEFWRLIRAR